MGWAAWSPDPGDRPGPSDEVVAALAHLVATLDAVLGPLGFAAGQASAPDPIGQVIFCRGDWRPDTRDASDDGCIDLVCDLVADPDLRIADVRYWGFPADRWHLPFPAGAALAEQLSALEATLPGLLAADAS